MTTYKTYQEAKIANPKEDIYTSMSGYFATGYYVGKLILSGCNQGWNKCNPADYCMTVEEFLEKGFKFVEGDIFMNSSGLLVTTFKYASFDGLNTIQIGDHNRYILQAKALEMSEREDIEDVEWENGDECIYKEKAWEFVSILSNEFHGTAVIFDRISEELKQVDLSTITKPETPQQREERILEELADEACENLFGDSIQNCRSDVAETVRWMINHGYRKKD